ncbi:hypothetical protein CHS0354_024172 [Potamilus streckersoni]|uniref:Lipoprotein LPP20-like domain-containing protein n=1 Tax=Potamilus streckersoni TaxID=2493646 RepID=A0AAE0RZU6_9BIVA|nr:hypothetical protein CHS0354_024172 [Potamilus streckersoni]
MYMFVAGALFAQTNVPFSKQAVFVESYSPTDVTIKATGAGVDIDKAEIDAQKAAVYFVLLSGTDPVLQTDEEKKKFQQVIEDFFITSKVLSYVSYVGNDVIKRIKTDSGLKIEKFIRVNREKLVKDLSDKGILVSRQDLLKSVGNPFIMVLPEVPKGKNPLEALNDPDIRKGSQVIEGYLTSRQYEVVVPEQLQTITELTELQAGMKGIEEDMSYQLAMSIGSDVYITYTIEVTNTYVGKKGIVGCRAYETTTARLLGTETGYSKERPGSADAVVIEEAMNDAIEKVLSRVNAYWKSDMEKGRQYKLVFKFLNKFEDVYEVTDFIDESLSAVTKARKQIVATEKTIDYVIWQNKYETTSEMFADINKKVKESGMFKLQRINVNRNSMVFAQVSPSRVVPEWIKTSKHPRYARSQYWLGIGVSRGENAREKSVDNARREIATQLMVSVEGTMSVKTEALMKNFAEDIEQSTIDQTNTKTKISNVSGIEIAETFEDKDGNVYALAVLSKDAYFEVLQSELDGLVSQVQSEKKSMLSALKQGDFGISLQSLTRARELLPLLLPKIAYYNSLGGQDRREYKIENLQEITKSFANAMSSLVISKVDGDNQKCKANSKLPNPFVVKAQISDLPLVGGSIVFKFGDEVIGKAETNSEGVANFTFVPTVAMAREKKSEIAAFMYLPSVFPSLKREVEKIKLYFTIYVTFKPFFYSLEVIGIGSKKNKSEVYTKLMTMLKDQGGLIQKVSPLQVRCVLQSEPKKEVQGFGGNVYSQTITATILFVGEDGSTITTLNGSGKSVGKNEENALEKAIDALQVDKSDLASAIVKVTDEEVSQ